MADGLFICVSQHQALLATSAKVLLISWTIYCNVFTDDTLNCPPVGLKCIQSWLCFNSSMRWDSPSLYPTPQVFYWFDCLRFCCKSKAVRSKLLDQKQFWCEHFLVVYLFHIQCVDVSYSAEWFHTYLSLHCSTVEYFLTELELLTGLSGGLDLMKSRISSWAFLFTLVGMSPPTWVRWETPHSL